MSKSQLFPLSAGTLIKDYEIIELLGSGSFGAVYKAKPRNGSFVALKETYYSSEKELKMFQNEASFLETPIDEDFPKLIDHFDDEKNRYYLVMELIEGDDLFDLLKKAGKPIELNKVLMWADNILESLESLHSNNIFHRDIKPDNLKLTPKGRIKILDLGLAKGYIRDKERLEYIGSVNIAADYFAPIEQHLRYDEKFTRILRESFESKTDEVLSQKTDARTDIYAFGATLYYLLTNKLPDISPSRAFWIWSGKPDLVTPAHEVNKNIPIEVSKVLHKALEIERDNRYASAPEMREALRASVSTIKNRSEQKRLEDEVSREKSLASRERTILEKEQVEAERLKDEQLEIEKLKKELENEQLESERLRKVLVEIGKLKKELEAETARKELLESERLKKEQLEIRSLRKQLEAETARNKQLEVESLQREQEETKRHQAEADDIQRQFREFKTNSKLSDAKWLFATASTVVLFVGVLFGVFGVNYLLKNTSSQVENTNINKANILSIANTANNSVVNVVNSLANKPTNLNVNVLNMPIQNSKIGMPTPRKTPTPTPKIDPIDRP
jgi:serine/threonine protein kinase